MTINSQMGDVIGGVHVITCCDKISSHDVMLQLAEGAFPTIRFDAT